MECVFNVYNHLWSRCMRHKSVHGPYHTLCRHTLPPSSCRTLCLQQRATSGSVDCTYHCAWCWRRETRIKDFLTFTSTGNVSNSWCVLPAPETWVIEGVQVGRVRPPDGVALAAQLHGPPRGQSRALAQAHKASLIQNLGQQGLAFPSCIFQSGLSCLHPFPSWSNTVLSYIFSPLDLLAGSWIRSG